MNANTLVRLSLNRILSSAGFSSGPVKAFTDWPTLEHVAFQFIYFVSPWLVVNGENLAEQTLRDAIASYDETLLLGYEVSHRKFIERIAASAKALSSIRVSVEGKDGLWSVWTYDEPLMRYLANHKRYAIQIRERDTPVASSTVMIKLLAAISPTKDLEVAGLDYLSLLHMSPSQ
ncbi:hypothetical protein [Sulfuricystis multivorans]|uniref:hypothetical protein n=1 Tax=Sulfuricystis multivorans TaxID=2211108 RepID=UPI000F820144|nr:hypothetical protein [Sulfuricystis multivorans]